MHPPQPNHLLHMYDVVCARQVFLRDARLCATTEFQMNLIDTSKSYPMKELTTRIKDSISNIMRNFELSFAIKKIKGRFIR